MGFSRADLDSNLETLERVVALMRREGIEELEVPTLRVKLSAHPPRPAPVAEALEESGDDENAIDRTQREEREARAQWASHWRRITMSSGAAIPAFPGLIAARRVLGVI